MRAALVVWLMLATSAARAEDNADIRVHLEIDPQPFILGGYGIQPGVRVGHLRAALGNFRLDVPDLITELGGNEGFHQSLRHSNALYILYFLDDRSGFAFGGSLRLLRLTFTRDGSTAERQRAIRARRGRITASTALTVRSSRRSRGSRRADCVRSAELAFRSNESS